MIELEYEQYQNRLSEESKIETKGDAYYCSICENYYDSYGNELNKFDAIDYYNVIEEACENCLLNDDWASEQDKDIQFFYNWMRNEKIMKGHNVFRDKIYLPIMRKIYK